jgi:general stress protein 26
MKKLFLLSMASIITFSMISFCKAEDDKFLYLKPGDMPKQHIIFDEEIKCVKCHPLKTKDIDGYTAATMTLTQSKLGVMPKADIEKRVVEALSGKHGREIFVLSTRYNNKPLSTVIELAVDPETLTFYSMSEKQSEKLFQMFYNDQVSFAYVKPGENYFKEVLSVQVVGKAKLLTGKDPEFEKGLEIYLPSLLPMINLPPNDPDKLNALKENIRKTKIMTKFTPERIVLKDISLRAKGLRLTQIWEK